MRVELFYFILGIIFIEHIYPLVESIVTVWLTALEAKKGKYTKIINDINLEIEGSTTSADVIHTIGFQLPDNNEEEDEEDEV